MKFAYVESMCDPLQYPHLAKAAEEARFSTFLVPDSLCYPEVSDSKYPYTEDGAREFLDGKPFIDPFVQIAGMAAVTERIEFLPFVLKAPIRHPTLLAKQAMSVAVMSQNRFLFGVGLSPWPDDYQVTDTQWKRRGARFDEMLEIMQGLFDGDYYSFKGEFYDIPSIKMTPAPDRRIPIFIGGHSEAALRRAARIGDGWVHAGSGGRDDTEELKKMIERMLELREEYQRDNAFRVLALSAHAFTQEGLKMLEDMGVTDVAVGFRDPYREEDTQSLDEKIKMIGEFGKAMI